MDLKLIRRAMVLSVGGFVLSATAVFADSIPADGDFLLPGNQATVDLGAYGPGVTLTRSVSFSLVCGGTSHPAENTTITIQPQSLSKPLDGAISSTSTTIGPVPASWPDSPAGCPSPQPVLPGNGPITVTLRTPTTPDIDYQYSIIYARLGASGLSGSTIINFTVDVVLNTPPTLSLPAPITVEATGPTGAAVAYAASAVDDQDDPDPTPICTPASGETFPLGTTNVSCSVADSGGLKAMGSFGVTVVDTTDPVLTVPGSMTVEAADASGAVVSYSASANDLVDPAPIVVCDPPSGETFPLGTTTVDCTATDASGNQASGSFDVLVSDTTGPVLALPADMTVEAADAAGVALSYTATAADAVDPTPLVVCDPSSGALFAMGTTTVNCTASDRSGNQSHGSFDVTVGDGAAPTLNLPSTIVREATGPSGAAVTFTATATDAVDPAPGVECTTASGSTFPLGTSSVSCTATDATGNTSTGSFDVVVRDTTAPSMTGVPSDMTVSSSSAAGTAVSYGMPSATDAVSGPRPVGCSPASGSTFPIGATTVRCSASDAAGNDTERAFSVTVTFDPPPTADYDIEWSEPISGGTLTTNPSRTVPLKFRLWVDGIEITSGDAGLSIAPCSGGSAVLTIDLTFSGGRWMGHLDTSDLGIGCFTATIMIEGQAPGSFTINVGAPDPKDGKWKDGKPPKK
jgi:hypothetical protein